MSKKKIFVIGDSISIQYGPYLMKELDGIYAYDRKGSKDFYSETLDILDAVNGGDSNRVLEYLKRENAKGIKYDTLLLNCGLHDIKRNPDSMKYQITIEKYEKNLKEITDITIHMSNEVIWVKTTPVNDKIHNTHARSNKLVRFNRDVIEYNIVADNIFENANIQIIDLYTYTNSIDDSEKLYADHVHFQPEIRKKQAGYIARQILENIDVTKYINKAVTTQSDIMTILRTLIHENIQGVSEAIKWGFPVFSKETDLVYFRTSKNHLTFGFNPIDKLEKFKDILEGTGSTMKHIKIRNVKDIDKALISEMLKAISS